ncbi:MAG TPA: tetratricopeptide repeat protein [Kofleriaceae bacterium]|nr:tetratricopeptide repeat protein [Kofleriaceae bacterium]
MMRIAMAALLVVTALGDARADKPKKPPAQKPQPQVADKPRVEQPNVPWAAGVPEDSQAKANALFAEGNELFGRDSHAEALAKYQAAIALWDHPMIRFNMAVTLIRLDRLIEAADELEHALRFGEQPFTPELYKQAVDYEKLVGGRVGELAATCELAGAHVQLDGKPWFVCGGSRKQRLLAGEHVLVIEKQGYLTVTRQAVVIGGKVHEEKLSLVPIESAMVLKYRYPRWIPYTIAASGAAIATGGTVSYLLGRHGMNQFEADVARVCANGCKADLSDQPTLKTDLHHAQLEGDIGLGLMIGGGAVAIGGIVMVFINSKAEHILPSVEATPVPGGATASVSWHY